MCDHGLLIEKCEDHRKVHHKFLQMFDNVIETVLCMKPLMAELNASYNEMVDLLKAPPKILASPSPHKRRKAQSFDSPSSATVIRKEETTPRNRSNPEVSASILDQNIDFPDTEDSFFALTQSPSRRVPLSPVKFQQENVPKTPPKKDPVRVELFAGQDEGKAGGGDKKKKKSILSLSRFASSFETSPETNKQAAMLPMRQKLTTPKPKGTEQENVVPPVGKWTAKKTPGVGKMDTSMRKTPTSSSKKDGSLLNRTRMRQTKLKFQDCMNKSFADNDDDETYFDEFVVPSPTSTTALSGTRFLKSAKKKEQSTLIAPPPKPKMRDTPGNEDFDIDQTYFSEAEKDLTRSKPFARPSGMPSTRIKVEPLTQKKSPPKSVKPSPVLAKDTQDSDTSSVLFVKPPSQDEIITIEETQPNKDDLFMKAIREQRRKEDDARQSVLNVMGPSKRDVKKEELFPTRSDFNVLRKPLLKVPSVGSNERRCSDCARQYQYLVNCGHMTDVARSKLPQNCRQCRLAQLHETPSGFWNPEFTPTQL